MVVRVLVESKSSFSQTMKLFIFFMYLKFSSSMFISNNDLKMVIDVIKSYEQPTALILHVCWKKSTKIAFMANLAEDRKPGTVQFISNYANFVPKQHVFFVIDLACPAITSFLNQANATEFRHPYRWLILGKSNNKSALISPELNKLNILADSNVIVSQSYGNDSSLLYLIYKSKVKGWVSEYFGKWTITYGLLKSKDMDISIPLRRKNLAREPLTISMVVNNERTKYELDDLQNVHIDTVTKLGFRQTEPLCDFVNATRIIIFTDTWGYFINGSWNGMVGHLINGEAELAGSVMFITEQRLGFVEYLSHPVDTTVRFVFREPPLSYQNNLFLLPFKWTVWYCIAAFIIILIFVLFINAMWENKKLEKQESYTVDHTILKPNISDITILVISAISQQGGTAELRGNLGRMVMFILFLTFLFLYTSYSASIVALLQSSSNQIKTLKDLLNSRLELGAEDTPYNRYFFSTATEPIRKAIYDTKIAARKSKPNFLNLEEGVKKLQETPFAFNMNIGIGYRIVEKYFYEHEKCGLHEIEYLQESVPWLSCRLNSPYKEMFKIGLFRIQEHGLTTRVNHLMLSKKPVCTTRGSSFGSVNMIDCYPALLMLIYGMILAFCLLFVEILVYKRGQKTSKNMLNNFE